MLAPACLKIILIFPSARFVPQALAHRALFGKEAADDLLPGSGRQTSSSIMQLPAMFTPMSVGDL